MVEGTPGQMMGATATGRRLPQPALVLLGRAGRVVMLGVSLVVTAIVGIALVATVLGYDLFVINGGSMAPSVPEGALVIAERVAPRSLEPGDVITFRRSSAPDSPVTHRVIGVEHAGSETAVYTKGDANDTPDAEPLLSTDPVSLVRFSLPLAGYVLAFLRTLPGQLLLIVAPVVFIAGRSVLALMRGPQAPEPARVPVAAVPVTAERGRPPLVMPSISARSSLPSIPSVPAAVRLPRVRVPSIAPVRLLGRLLAGRLGAPTLGRSRVESALPSARTARIREAVEEPSRLASELAASLAQALQPVERLSHQLSERSAAIEAALERALRPMTEYADQLEANLERLEAGLGGLNLVPGSPLAMQATAERQRLREVRAAIEGAKEPLRATLRREAQALDAVLAPLDSDVTSFELMVRQQRRHLVKILAGLQSDQFRDAIGVMQQRTEQIGVLAALGEADQAEVDAVLAMTDAERARLAASSPYLAAALAILAQSAEGEAAGDEAHTAA